MSAEKRIHVFEGHHVKEAATVLPKATELLSDDDGAVASLILMPDAHVREGALYGVSMLLRAGTSSRQLVALLSRYEDLTASTAVYNVQEPRDIATNEASYVERAAKLYGGGVKAPPGHLRLGGADSDFEFGDESSRITLAYRISGRTSDQVLVVHSFSHTIACELKAQLAALSPVKSEDSDAELERAVKLFERAQARANRQRDELAKAFAKTLGLQLTSAAVTSEDGTATERIAQPRLQTPTTTLVRLSRGSYAFNAGVSTAAAAQSGDGAAFVHFMRPLDGVVVVTSSEQHVKRASHVFPVSSHAITFGAPTRYGRGSIIAAGGFPEPAAAAAAAATAMHEQPDTLWRRPLEARFRALMRDSEASVLDYVPVFTLFGGVDARARSIHEHLEAAERLRLASIELPLEHAFVPLIVPIYVTSYRHMFGGEAVPLREIFKQESASTLLLETSLVRNLLDAASSHQH